MGGLVVLDTHGKTRVAAVMPITTTGVLAALRIVPRHIYDDLRCTTSARAA